MGEGGFEGWVLELVIEGLEFSGDYILACDDCFLSEFGAEGEFCGECGHGEDGGAVECFTEYFGEVAVGDGVGCGEVDWSCCAFIINNEVDGVYAVIE